MDIPFKKERKTEIGVDMTPGRIKKMRNVPEFKPGDILKLSSHGGGGMKFFPHGSDEAPAESAPVVKAPPIPRYNNAPSSSESAETPKSTSGESATGKKYAGNSGRKGGKQIFKQDRRCIVKVDYRNITSSGRKASQTRADNRRMVSARLQPFMKPGGSTVSAQVGYIKRDEAIEGCLFNYRGNGLQALDDSLVINQFDNRPTLTVILSPEDEGIDLYELTKRFMKDIYIPHAASEPLFWCAAIHGNTDHKHVHIILSAEDINGNDARIDRNYVHSGSLQKDTTDILNDMNGYRTWKEQLRLEKKAKNKLSYTWLDKKIFKAAEPQEDGTLMVKLKDTAENDGLKYKISRRLQFLKRQGLAKNTEDKSGTWYIQPGTKEKLRRQDFAEAFGLTEEDFDNMVLDNWQTPPYAGTIIETVLREDEGKSKKSQSSQTMLFMIKETDEEGEEGEEKKEGKIHLRRETFKKSESMEKELFEVSSVTKAQIKAGIAKGLQAEKEGPTRG